MRIIYVIGRLGMGGDTVAVLNALYVMLREEKIKCSDVDFITHDIGYNNETLKQLEKKGHAVFVMQGDVRRLGPVKYFSHITKILKENGPYDVIHVHTSMQSGISLCAAKFCGIPVRICHSHTNSIQRETSKWNRLLASPVLKFLIRCSSTKYAACGEAAGAFLFGRLPFVVLKNGIKIEEFEQVTQKSIDKVKSELGISKNQYVIGHVGRFSRMKNQKFILDLAIELKDRKDLVFILVGDGEDFNSIHEQIKADKLNCILTGRRKDIPVLMSMMDLLILPSKPGEGFPVTLVEAQAAGCPCLVSDTVTKEVSLISGLIQFISIHNKSEWLEAITNTNRKKESRKECCMKIRQMGFAESDAAKAWYELYNV